MYKYLFKSQMFLVFNVYTYDIINIPISKDVDISDLNRTCLAYIENTHTAYLYGAYRICTHDISKIYTNIYRIPTYGICIDYTHTAYVCRIYPHTHKYKYLPQPQLPRVYSTHTHIAYADSDAE